MRWWQIWKAVKEGRHAATDVKEFEQTLEKKGPETCRRDLL
jgi:hypothetical protein